MIDPRIHFGHRVAYLERFKEAAKRLSQPRTVVAADEFARARATGVVERAQQSATALLAACGIQAGGPNPWDITVHDPKAYVRLLKDPDLQLGVLYMDGLWDCPSVDQFMTRLAQADMRHKLASTPTVLLRNPLLLAEAGARLAYRYVRDSLTNRQTVDRSTKVAKEHYDVGNVLYSHQLGPTLSYTSGVFAEGYSLEDAQNAKHDLLCRKMNLQPGDRVLDIGCGFGGFARYAAKNYGAQVVGLTISNEQLKAARALSHDVDGVTFMYSDYRDIPKRFPKDHFDHVVSIEMIEAVGHHNLQEYFDCAQSCLKQGGSFALQAICQDQDAVNCNAWFSEYIFHDGVAPSRNQVDRAAASWFGGAEDVHRFSDSYDKTLMCWHDNFEKSWPEIKSDYNDRFKRMWDFYLRGVAGWFRGGRMHVDQVVYRKGGPDDSRASVRELPSRARLDALRATPVEAAAIKSTVAEVAAHTREVAKAAAPRPVRHSKPLALDARVCVIGAGPSGLSVARELANKGYTNVVVLEGSDRVGGKSFTVDIAGRAHDLGATMGVPKMYADIVELADGAGVRTVKFPEQVQYDLATGKPRPARTWSESAAFFAGSLQFLRNNHAQRGKSGEDLEVPREELAEPFGIVATRHGFTGASASLDTYLTGYGYGFPGTTPAVFAYRMLSPLSMVGAGTGELLMWENGTAPIWEGVAKGLDVRSSTPVLKLDRSGELPVVTTAAGKMTFDRVVVAVDPATATGFLDSAGDEKQLLSLVKHMPYSTFACRVAGVADGRSEVGYLRENMNEDRAGHPMAWIKRYADDDVFVFHLFAPEGMDDDAVMARIREDMGKLGASSVELVDSRRWKFFPHVDGDAMRQEKFFERFRNLQGDKGTFFANEVLSMSTMANVNQFAKTIAERVATSG